MFAAQGTVQPGAEGQDREGTDEIAGGQAPVRVAAAVGRFEKLLSVRHAGNGNSRNEIVQRAPANDAATQESGELEHGQPGETENEQMPEVIELRADQALHGRLGKTQQGREQEQNRPIQDRQPGSRAAAGVHGFYAVHAIAFRPRSRRQG